MNNNASHFKVFTAHIIQASKEQNIAYEEEETARTLADMTTRKSGREKPGSSLTQPGARLYFYLDDSEEESQPGSQRQDLQHAPRDSNLIDYKQPFGENSFIDHSPRSQSTRPSEEDFTISHHPEYLVHTQYQDRPDNVENDEFDQDEEWHLSSESDSNINLIGSHTQSKSWVSWPQRQMDKWHSIQPKLMRMYPTGRNPDKVCPFVPRDASQWCRHIAEINAAEQATLARKMAQHEESKRLGFPESYMTKPLIGKKLGTMEDGEDKPPEIDDFLKTVAFKYSLNPPTRGYVLAERTIWCPAPSVPWRQQPAWPCKGEMEWEGDQRVATENGRFGRYPPLPRVDPNNDSVAWHLKPRLRPYQFDDPWLVPTMEDIYLPVDQIEDPEIIASLLNSDLFTEIDNPPIPVRVPKCISERPYDHWRSPGSR